MGTLIKTNLYDLLQICLSNGPTPHHCQSMGKNIRVTKQNIIDTSPFNYLKF